MRKIQFFLASFAARWAMLLILVCLAFTNCADDEPSTPTPTPVQPDPDPDPDPDPEIPVIAPTNCDFNLDEDSLVTAGWSKSFEENFDGDLSKWSIWTGGAFNNELQYYQGANASISDGELVITAKRETVTGATSPFDQTQKTFDFTSARLECKSSVSASSLTPKVRMIARIKLPAGYALWPAFWSYGDPWPTQGEIDFLEFRGSDTKKYQTNYFYGTTAGANLVQGAEGIIEADTDLTECYHVFEMIWERDKLTSILDGTVVEIKKSGNYITSMYGRTQHIVLNLAAGGAFFSNVDPSKIEGGQMKVDWVKVYTAK